MAVLTAQNGGLAIQELKPGTYCNKASFSWAWLSGNALCVYLVATWWVAKVCCGISEFLKANFVIVYRTGHGHFYSNTLRQRASKNLISFCFLVYACFSKVIFPFISFDHHLHFFNAPCSSRILLFLILMSQITFLERYK
jgi:hypothetical protein